MTQLSIFLKHMHPFLQKQQLDYQIFIVEQVRFYFVESSLLSFNEKKSSATRLLF